MSNITAAEIFKDGSDTRGDDLAARQAALEFRIVEEMDRERTKREARRRLDAEARGPVAPPDVRTLREHLADPRRTENSRVDGWLPLGGRAMLAAQFKAGKTILVGNLTRCLVDGDLWLGRDGVRQVEGSVVVLDFEMSPWQLVDWLRAQRIRNDHKVVLIPMRGQGSGFDILDAATRAEWVTRFRTHRADVLILDCLRPMLDALGLDEHHDTGRFLGAFDALLRDAGIGEALVVHHMGHNGERARGDSRLRDWPDVEWRLIRQDDDPASARYLAAYGRDVDQRESQLTYDSATRRLTIGDGSRRDATARDALADVLAILNAAPTPLSGLALETTVKASGSPHPRSAIRTAVALGIQGGEIITSPGARGAILHASSPARRTSPSACRLAPPEFADAYRGGEVRKTQQSTFSSPRQGEEGSADAERF